MHAAVWLTALLLCAALLARWLRVLALDVEALTTNLHQGHLVGADAVGWARALAQWGAAPLLLLVIAAALYRLPPVAARAASPLPRLPRGARLALGAGVWLAAAAAAGPLGAGLAIGLAVEVFGWIEWHRSVVAASNTTLAWATGAFVPAALWLAARGVGFALTAPPARRPGWVRRALVGGTTGLALIAAGAVAGAGAAHNARLPWPAGTAAFEQHCDACHPRSRPLYFVKAPAEWEEVVARMQATHGASIDDGDAARIADFLAGDRGFGDAWTFRTRCSRCHGLESLTWEDRTAADWRAIVDRVGAWSPYHHRPAIRAQVTAHLVRHHGDEQATAGLDADTYRAHHAHAARCGGCHSVGRPRGRLDDDDDDELRALVRRMGDKRPQPADAARLQADAASTRALLALDDGTFARLFPHDRPVIEEAHR